MRNWPKVSSDFSTLQKVSVEELALKTQAYKEAWDLGKIDRWELSQDTGELVFSLLDGMQAVCPAQIIGTYNSEDRAWMWAWANPSRVRANQPDSVFTMAGIRNPRSTRAKLAIRRPISFTLTVE
ncbi:MAG TPA: hypothetical protein VFV58_17375 [Blastocatellia bacterium]|jgi:hypothetical protein|nr:hypothetical protein [Blastocatellia bacterium]